MRVEFHYDFGSPNCFFAHRYMPGLAERTGLTIHYVPILLGGVFKTTNNRSPMEAFGGVKGKLAYQQREMARFIMRHGIEDYAWNPNFPINTLPLMRGACYAADKPWSADYVEAMFRAMWSEARAMGDPAEIGAALAAAGLPAEEIFAGAQDPGVKQMLIANTEASVARGNFGAPALFVDDEMFFGKDSLTEAEAWIHDRL